MMNSRCFKYILMCSLFLTATVVHAQFLPTGDVSSAPKRYTSSVRNVNASRTAPVSAAQAAVADKELNKNSPSPFEYSKLEVEKNNQPKAEAVTITDKNGKKLNDEVILIYMKNFNVYRTATKQVRCSVRFAAISTYKEKISNVSYELKWPKMSTRLSFSDMTPQIEYYIDYLLLGDGCYTMDKTPNVIINRCRVKNVSQEACAASVRWINFNM